MTNKFTLSMVAILLSGCASSPTYQALEDNQKNMKVVPIDEAQNIQLTYRFRNSLVDDERKEFLDYLQQEDNQQQLSSLLNDSINATKGFAKATLNYTPNWGEALKSGHMMDNLGLSAIAGLGFAALSNALTYRHRFDFDYYIDDDNQLSADQTTQKYRKKTIAALYDFAQQYNYKVTCTFGCNDDNTPNNSGESVLILTSNSEKFNGHYKPKNLSINLSLKPLIKTDTQADSLLLNQAYQYRALPRLGWRIKADSAYNTEKPQLLTLKDGRQTYGDSFFVGSYFGNLFYRHLTNALPGFSYYYYQVDSEYAFVNGKAYVLNDELTKQSIIKGEIIN